MFTYTAFLGTFADIIVCKAGHNHNKQLNCLNITISMKESALFMKNDDFGVQKMIFGTSHFSLKKKKNVKNCCLYQCIFVILTLKAYRRGGFLIFFFPNFENLGNTLYYSPESAPSF